MGRELLVVCTALALALAGCAQAATPAANRGSAPKRIAWPATPNGELLENETPNHVSAANVARVVAAHKEDLRACYASEARADPTLQGGGDLTWQILPDGSVSSPMLTRTTLGDLQLEECILRKVRGWRFPPAESQTNVASFSFHFPM